jgi:hypothetical protein
LHRESSVGGAGHLSVRSHLSTVDAYVHGTVAVWPAHTGTGRGGPRQHV